MISSALCITFALGSVWADTIGMKRLAVVLLFLSIASVSGEFSA